MDKFEFKCFDNDTSCYIQPNADGIFHLPVAHNIALICLNETNNGLYNYVWDSNVEDFNVSGNVDTIFFRNNKNNCMTGIYCVTVTDLESAHTSKLSTTLFFYETVKLQLTGIINRKQIIVKNNDVLYVNFYDKIKIIPTVTNISNLTVEYKWQLNNKTVSTEPCYKPKHNGHYTVLVINNGEVHASSNFKIVSKPLAEQILDLLP